MGDTPGDDYDDFDWYEDGDNYDYVEDGYTMADDLAAQAVPDAPEFEGADYWDDQSRYEYWNDIEYDTDGYNDDIKSHGQSKKKQTSLNKSPTKTRKRSHSHTQEPFNKRRRIHPSTSESQSQLPPVLLLKKDALKARRPPTIDVDKLSSYSVLPNWREQFQNRFTFGSSRLLHVQQTSRIDENEEMIEDDEEEYEEEMQSIPMDVLKKALQDHLGTLGLNIENIKEDILLQLAERMLSGNDDGNELLDQLVEGIHGEEEEEEPADSFSQWVSGQVGSSKIPEGDPIQPSLNPETISMQTADFNNTNHVDSKLPSPIEKSQTNSSSSRGAKRRAESPSVSPRKKKSNRPPDRVSARG